MALVNGWSGRNPMTHVQAEAEAELQGAETPRVIFVTDQFLPRVGGAEILTLREAVALRRLGVRTRIVTPRLERHWARREEFDGVPVRRFGGVFFGRTLRLRFGAQWIAEARLWLELVRHRREYDVVHLRQLTYLARPAVLAALLTRKPLVVQIAAASEGTNVQEDPAATRLYVGTLDPSMPFLHVPAATWGGPDIERLRRWQWTAGLTLRLLRRRGIAFLAVSQGTRTYLIDNGVPSGQIALLATGIETARYALAAASVEQRLAARAERVAGAAGAAAAPPTVLYAGRHNYEKGLDILLHAWQRVQRQVPEARLLVAGDGPLAPQMAALAAALGLDGTVTLLGPRGDIPDLMARADVFVLPSRFDGLSNVLLEAMAAGLPCIASRVSGSLDVIVDGESGLLVPPEEPEALAEALLRLLARPAEALRLGRAARARVMAHYERETQMRRLVGLYQHVLHGGTAKTWRPEQGEPAVAAPASLPARASQPVGLVD